MHPHSNLACYKHTSNLTANHCSRGQLLVQPRRNKSERYGSLWKGEREEGEHEHAPSKRDPLESQFGAARGTATPSAPLHESPTAGASWEDHSGSSSRSQQYEDHPGPAGGS